MLKGLTSSFSFVFFFGELSNSVHKQNQTTVADPGEGAGGPALLLLLDHQTEARRAEKNFFETAPPPNLVPRAFPLNGWGGKRPWHRLVTCTA